MTVMNGSGRKPPRKLFCYSLEGFADAMKQKDLKRSGSEDFVDAYNMAVISICCTDTVPTPEDHLEEGEIPYGTEEHYFKKSTPHILNIEFDDLDPQTWHEEELDLDNAQPVDFMWVREDNEHYKTILYSLDYKKAREIVDFIDANLGRDFYIHCSAGVSRSQGVVRYILDEYYDYAWQIRKENPPFYPNFHVVRMLKRAKREKDNK